VGDGITQHRNGVANVQSIVNFALLRGQIGRRGAGLCPVRGHSNVQGRSHGRHLGEDEPAVQSKLSAKNSVFHRPRKHGLDTVNTIQAIHEGRVKVLVALGGNFLSATPDTKYTSEAIQRCKADGPHLDQVERAHLVTGESAPHLAVPRANRARRSKSRANNS